MQGSVKFQYHFKDNTGTTLSDYSLYNNDATLTTDGSGNWSSETPFDSSSNAFLNSPNSYQLNGGDYFKHDVSDNWSGSFTLSCACNSASFADYGLEDCNWVFRWHFSFDLRVLLVG